MSTCGLGPQGRGRGLGGFASGFLLVLTGMLPALAAQASTTVGTIPGTFAVSSAGAATYSIPVALPRGSGGLTPSLALVYSSQSGSSAAGWGWTFSGLSAVTRCNKTIDDDNVTQAVQLQSTDDYCLDGQRLRVTSGTSGTDGATYDTELRAYDLITSHVVSSDTGGPSYWTVQTKDGTTYEYGYTTGSSGSRIYATNPNGGAETVVRVWALDKVTDANGNYYTITYQNNDTTTGDFWPLTINYSGNNNKPSSPDHTVTFGWNTRSPESTQASFVAGTLVTQTQLLSTITVSYNNSAAFTYNLYYNGSTSLAPPSSPGDNRYQLTEVQECAADGNCFNPTKISWQEGAAGWGAITSTGIDLIDYAHAESLHLADVNGDGIADLLYPGSSYWMVAYGQPGGGFSAAVTTNIPVGNYQWALATDGNGDGLADLVVPETDGMWHLYESEGGITGQFSDAPTGLSDTGTNSVTGLPIYEGNAAMADYSGRGLGDFLSSTGTEVELQPNNGPGTNPRFGSAQGLGAVGNFDLAIDNGGIESESAFVDTPMDFDGSGRAGELGFSSKTVTTPCNPQDNPGCQPTTTTTYYWTALASTPSGYQSMGTLSCADNVPSPLPFDATGGGLTDLLFDCYADGTVAVELTTANPASTGADFVSVPTTVAYDADDPVLADYYGDGRDEAIVPSMTSGWTMIRVNYDAATPGFVVATSSIAAPLPASYEQGTLRVGAIEALGLNDLVFVEGNSGSYSVYYALHARPSSGIADTVTNITDGLGNSFSPSYALLTGTSAYTEASGTVWPVRDVTAPLAVVTSYSASDGSGGNYTETYSYAGAEQEVTGRGFLGFASRSVTDSRNGVTMADTYDQSYPFIGSVAGDSVTQSNGKVLSQTSNTFASSPASCSGGALCFPYLSTSTTTVNDATSGSPLKTIQTGNTFGDGYGDLTQQTVTTTDSASSAQFISTKEIGYTPNTSTYCIDLPTSVSITKIIPGGASFTRSAESPPGSSGCRAQYVEMNPNGQSNGTPWLKTAYGYDPWGNVDSTTVSGTSLTTRTNSADYSTYNGEYPDKLTNALGQNTEEAWDPARGVETSMTDPNEHTTSFGYDGFGRRTSETLPDGVTQSWSYNACGSCMSTGSYYIVASVSNNGGTQTVPAGMTEYDAKGRIVATGKVLLGGTTSYVETQYDALGRPVAVSAPFLSSPTYYTDTTYDVLNRPVKITAPANASSGSEDVTNISYDGFTATATKSAPSGDNSNIASETTVTATDALGEVVSKTDGSGSASATTIYTYDPFGELVSTTDADSHTTQMKYDALGHKYWMSDPNMGTWSYGVDGLGEVLTQTDADGNTITQNYDALGRLTSRVEKNPSGTIMANDTWTWDSAANGVGLLASESNSMDSFQKVYTYDSLSRPEDVDTTANGTDYQVSTSYDSFGRVATVTYPASVSPSAPTVSASASPTAAVVGNSITLTATATDPDGLAVSYQWSQTAGPATVTLGSPTSASTTVTTSTPGNYSFQVVAADQNAYSSPASVSVTFVPPAPGTPAISPSPSYNGAYTVSWSTVSTATSYDVYESSDGTNYSELGSVTGTSDAISGKINGTYYYEIGACANNVCGSNSAAASVQVLLPPGSAPGGLSLSPNPSTTGSYTLSWGAVATATSYDIYLSVNGGSYGALPSTTSMSYSTSEGDGTYGYEVEACNAAGCSGASSSVTETVTLPPGAPPTPTVSPSPSANGSFTVSWSAPSNTWTSMQFQESPDGANWTTEATSGTSWSASGFGDGTYYFHTIYCDSSACSTSGTASETVLLPPGVPGTPGASPNPSTSGSYTLSWGAVSTATSYDLYLSANGGSYSELTSTTATSYSPSEGDGSYGYEVTACNASGCSSPSAAVTESVTLAPGTPATPSASPDPSTNGDFTVSWSAPSNTWTGMEFQESPDDSSWTTETTSGTSWSASGFGNGTYYFRTIYCDGSACSTSGTGSESVTLPPGTPGTPAASPNPSGNGSFTVTWSAPSGTWTSLSLQESPNDSSWTTEATSGSSWSASGFGQGTFYFRTIYCNGGACSTSGSGSEQVLYVPGVPPSVSASPTSIAAGGEFMLYWGASSGTVSYYVANGSGTDGTHYSPSTYSAEIFPGRTGNDDYTVQACNAAGCSADSATVTVTVGGGGGCKYCSPETAPKTTSPASTTSAPAAATGGGWANVILTRERARMFADVAVQPSEAAMQAMANARTRAALPSLLPPASAEDVAAWKAQHAEWQKSHPGGPDFAPPEYIAYANAKLTPASSTPYRFEVQYNYDPNSGALVSVENAQTGFGYWQAAMGGGEQ